MLTAISTCSSGRPSSFAISLNCRVSSSRRLVRYDLPGDAALAVDALDLQQQALPQAARAHSRRIERMHHVQRLFDVLRFVFPDGRDFVQRRRQIAVFVQVADDRFGRVADLFRDQADAQLRPQMVAQRHAEPKGTSRTTAFRPIPKPGSYTRVQIVVEERAEIDLIERVGGRRSVRAAGHRRRSWSRLGGRGGSFFRRPGISCR